MWKAEERGAAMNGDWMYRWFNFEFKFHIGLGWFALAGIGAVAWLVLR